MSHYFPCKELNVGGNAHYTSKRIVQELVITLAQQIEDSQLHALRTGQFYGLMIHESTDVSITKQLVLYGTAECIEEAV